MPTVLPIPIAIIPEGRAALARMYIDLTLAFHASIYSLSQARPTNMTAI